MLLCSPSLLLVAPRRKKPRLLPRLLLLLLKLLLLRPLRLKHLQLLRLTLLLRLLHLQTLLPLLLLRPSNQRLMRKKPARWAGFFYSCFRAPRTKPGEH